VKLEKEANPKSEKTSAVTLDPAIEELEQITAPSLVECISFSFPQISWKYY